MGFNQCSTTVLESGHDLMTMADVAARLQVSRRELLRIRQSGAFPAPLNTGNARAIFWRASTINDWCKANRR